MVLQTPEINHLAEAEELPESMISKKPTKTHGVTKKKRKWKNHKFKKKICQVGAILFKSLVGANLHRSLFGANLFRSLAGASLHRSLIGASLFRSPTGVSQFRNPKYKKTTHGVNNRK